MIYKFKLEYNTTETIKNISYVTKSEGCAFTFRHISLSLQTERNVTNLDDQARSGKPKTVDSEGVVVVSGVNPVSEYFLQSRVVRHHNFGAIELCLTLTKY